MLLVLNDGQIGVIQEPAAARLQIGVHSGKHTKDRAATHTHTHPQLNCDLGGEKGDGK